ncbi:hypothetical protein C8J56DRAFT_1162656 [Mycena floridula]|nr:hypothetical protein C8J56DRAFT_1162656 [Mycena floridula]
MADAIQPSPLSDSDILGLKDFLIQAALQLILHGIYTTLVMIVLYKLWTNKTPLAARCILIVASISMFVASTTQISLDLAFYLIQLSTLGFDPPNVDRPLINMNIFTDTTIRLNYLIGDSVVVWRAWILWTNHPRVHTLLCICLIGTFVGVTIDFALVILFDLTQLSDSPRFSSPILRSLTLILPLFLTNFISTLLIAYQVRQYKVEIKRNLGLAHNKRTKVERVLILLMESGSIYCLLWLSILVFALKSSDYESLPYLILASILPPLVAMYPTIIILLIALEKANLESIVNDSSLSHSLQFASRSPVPTATQSDDVAPGSMTSHVELVMPDPNTDDMPEPTMDDRLDSTTDDKPDSNTNDISVEEPLGERMEKHSSNHFG